MIRLAAVLAAFLGTLSALAPLPGARVAADDADVTPPGVVAVTPEPGPGAPTRTAVTVTFDEAVQNVTAATFVLRDEDGKPQEADVSWDPATFTSTLTTRRPLTIASGYTAKLRQGIADLAGNELDPVLWSFTTTDRVVFGPGTFTGYRFDSERTTFRDIKRSALDEPASPTADRFKRINGQGFLHISGGRWEGFWVHGRPWGRARHDGEAPVTFRPACSYRDLPSARAAYAQWATSVLDTLFRLPTGYQPSGLVDTSRAGLNGGHRVRRVVLDDLTAMVRDARRAGAYLAVQSAYRSYASQVATFDYWVRHLGYAEALKVSARPGHSEHQLGTTIDFRSAGGSEPWGAFDWGATREGTWMKRNAWKYGWVMSYPWGSFAASCYNYEPWHYRYVGRTLAAAIHDAGRPPRAYLWRKGFGIR